MPEHCLAQCVLSSYDPLGYKSYYHTKFSSKNPWLPQELHTVPGNLPASGCQAWEYTSASLLVSVGQQNRIKVSAFTRANLLLWPEKFMSKVLIPRVWVFQRLHSIFPSFLGILSDRTLWLREGREKRPLLRAPWEMNHRITEWTRLEKTFNIIKSNHQVQPMT